MSVRRLISFAFVPAMLLAWCAAPGNLGAQSPTFDGQVLALAPEATLPAALKTDVLTAVPDNALGLVVANDLKELKSTVEAVLRKLQVPFENDDYQRFNDFVDGIKGWDPKAMHAFAVFSGGDGEDPKPAFFIPVSDYKEFTASLGAEVTGDEPVEFDGEEGPNGTIGRKGNFAIISEKGESDFIKELQNDKSSVAAKCEAAKGWIGKHQVTGLVLDAGLKLMFDGIVTGLEKAETEFPADNPQAAMVKSVFGIYKNIATAGRDEVGLLAVGYKLSAEQGLAIGMQAQLKADGRVAASLKGIDPLPAAPLAGLPDSAYLFAGAGVFPQQWMDGLMDLSMAMIKAAPQAEGEGLTPEQMQQLIDLSKQQMKGIKSASMSVDLSGKTLMSGIYGIYHVTDAKAYIDQYEKSLKAMAELMKKGPVQGMPAQEGERVKIGGLDAIKITVDMSAMIEQMQAAQPAPIPMKPIFEQMFGPGGKIVGYVAAVDEDSIVMAYDEDSLTAFAEDVKAGKKGLADNVNVKATASLLPTTNHWVGYMNMAGYVDLAKKVFGMVMAAQGGGGAGFIPPIPPFPDAPPIGFAAGLGSSSIEAHVVIPMSTAEATRDYVMQVGALFGGLR